MARQRRVIHPGEPVIILQRVRKGTGLGPSHREVSMMEEDRARGLEGEPALAIVFSKSKCRQS